MLQGLPFQVAAPHVFSGERCDLSAMCARERKKNAVFIEGVDRLILILGAAGPGGDGDISYVLELVRIVLRDLAEDRANGFLERLYRRTQLCQPRAREVKDVRVQAPGREPLHRRHMVRQLVCGDQVGTTLSLTAARHRRTAYGTWYPVRDLSPANCEMRYFNAAL